METCNPDVNLLSISTAMTSDSLIETLTATFKSPPPQYGIYPIMHSLCRFVEPDSVHKRSVSHLVGQEEPRHTLTLLEQEVLRLQRRGFGGVVTNVGWGNDYLKNWQPIQQVIAELKKKGFVVYLYDEKGYPSGSAGGLVLEKYPHFEAIGMMAYRYPRLLRGPADYRADLPDGQLYKALLLPAVEDHENSPVELKGLVDVTHCADRYGTLRFTIPPGRWVFVVLFKRRLYDATHCMLSYSEPRRYINLLESRAGRAFVNITHERYFKALASYFGSTIKAIFTDEPSLQPPLNPANWPYHVLPWSDILPAAFRRRYGRSIDEALLATTLNDVGPRTSSLRCDFWELIADKCAEGFFVPVEKWCAKHRIAATGHLLWEESISRHVSLEGSYFRAMRHFHIPGIDMLSSRPEFMMNSCIVPKLAASVARLLGKSEVMSEASNHNERVRREKAVTLSEIRSSMNWHFALGVNVITSYYDLDRFSDTTMRHLNRYVARLGAMLRRGEPVTHVAVLYPEQTIWAATTGGRPSPRLLEIEKCISQVCSELLAHQVDFDFIDEQAVRNSSIKGNKLIVESRQYFCLVLPAVSILDQKLADVICRFGRAGGVVIALSVIPSCAREITQNNRLRRKIEELRAHGRLTFVSAAGPAFVQAVKQFATIEVKPASRLLLVHHRHTPELDIYFVANMARTAFKGQFTFVENGIIREWNPENGLSRTVKPNSIKGNTRIFAWIPALSARFYTIEQKC